MSADQILAILQLLIAFYVPQDRVDIVKAILEDANKVSVVQVAPAPTSPVPNFGSVNAPAVTQATPLSVTRVLFQKDNAKGKLVFETTSNTVKTVRFYKGDGTLLATDSPVVTSVYSDGNRQYFAYAPQTFEQYGNGATTYFYAVIEKQDGGTFTTNVWRAYYVDSEFADRKGWRYQECIVDYCSN